MHALALRFFFALLLWGLSAACFATPTLTVPALKTFHAVIKQNVHYNAFRKPGVPEHAEAICVPVVKRGTHYLVVAGQGTAVFDTVLAAQGKEFLVVPVELAVHAQSDGDSAGFLILFASKNLAANDEVPFSSKPESPVIGQVALQVVIDHLADRSANQLKDAFISVAMVRERIANQ